MTSEHMSKKAGKQEKSLTPEQHHVLRKKGTERPFTGKYLNNKKNGMYVCAGCGSKLFDSATKFDSDTGWPSFTEPAERANIVLKPDNSLFMRRTEVICRKCGGHLGHVFDDGPKKTEGGAKTSSQRFCINSCALDFKEKSLAANETL